MLKQLVVQDFVLIDECKLDFESGFSAFTGETGAGKSLLIDAMCLLAGDRASTSFIKQNANKAVVEGTFDLVKNPAVLQMLKENGFVSDDFATFRREINRDGKSSVFINKKPATLNLLKDCIQHEIDIHSQHDTQYLLNKTSQLYLLDQLVQERSLIKEVQERYKVFHELKKEYELAIHSTYNENDLEFIQMEIDEINQAKLSVEEEEALEKRQKEIQSFEKTFQHINEAIHILDDEEGANEKLYAAVHQLSNLGTETLEGLAQRLTEYYNEILDVKDQLQDYVEQMDMSEDEINELQSRLYEIQRLKRKFGPSVEAIHQHRDELMEQVMMISNRQAYIEKMEVRIEEAHDAFYEQAQKLSELRKKEALHLQTMIELHLQDLMLPHARFVVDFQPFEGNRTGIDDIEFYISMNPGEMPRPLARVASGGELSRFMLGLKIIFTKLQGIQTVIFDEIDTGVSGAVATAIGMKMAKLGEDAQVFSVTHLAQVAACAKNHYLVKKVMTASSTATQVVKTSEQERIEQLALIASGTVSEVSLNAAKELYTTCQTKLGNS